MPSATVSDEECSPPASLLIEQPAQRPNDEVDAAFAHMRIANDGLPSQWSILVANLKKKYGESLYARKFLKIVCINAKSVEPHHPAELLLLPAEDVLIKMYQAITSRSLEKDLLEEETPDPCDSVDSVQSMSSLARAAVRKVVEHTGQEAAFDGDVSDSDSAASSSVSGLPGVKNGTAIAELQTSVNSTLTSVGCQHSAEVQTPPAFTLTVVDVDSLQESPPVSRGPSI